MLATPHHSRLIHNLVLDIVTSKCIIYIDMSNQTCVWTSVGPSIFYYSYCKSHANMLCRRNVVKSRLSGDDLAKFQAAEAAFNEKYGAEVKTEHAFNGLGIIDKASQPSRFPYPTTFLYFSGGRFVSYLYRRALLRIRPSTVARVLQRQRNFSYHVLSFFSAVATGYCF